MAIVTPTVLIQSSEEKKQDLAYFSREADFLAIRQKLKDEIRRKKRNGLASATSAVSSQEHKDPSYDNFGSFFGPSEPDIARRVIQQARKAMEIKQIASTAKKPVQIKTKSCIALQDKKKKQEMLRYARDYSFLDSPRSDHPTSDPSQRSESSKRQEIKAQFQTKSVAEDVKLDSLGTKIQPKSETSRKSEAKILLVTKRKHEQDKEDVLESKKKAKLMSENLQHRKHLQQKMPQSSVKEEKKKFLKTTDKQKEDRQQSSNGKKTENTVVNPICSNQHKLTTKNLWHLKPLHQGKLQSSTKEEKKKVVETKNQKNESIKKFPESSNVKRTGKYTVIKPKSSIQHKITRPHQAYTHDESINADFNSILQMLSRGNRGRQHNRRDYCDDVDCMVSSFDDIQKEERKSARIARKEDEIERLRLEKEEKLGRRKTQKLK